jgi:hypothetical protein
MNSDPRDHHFVPAFYLKHWALPVENTIKVVEYSIPHKKVVSKLAHPESTGFQRDLYALDELPPEKRQYLEKGIFNYSDRIANQALNVHLGLEDSSIWNDELHSGWSRFVLNLYHRHPDVLPDVKAVVDHHWGFIDEKREAMYQANREPHFPATYREYLDKLSPEQNAEARRILIEGVFDNEKTGQHMSDLKWAVFDLSNATTRLVTSDRPVYFYKMPLPRGNMTLPISPTKLFIAANQQSTIDAARNIPSEKIVRSANLGTVARARRYVWSQDKS